jgi:hypothetical protein
MPLNEEETIKDGHCAAGLRVMGEGFARFYGRLALIAKRRRRRHFCPYKRYGEIL